jgi:hypothetical protein
MGNILGKEKPLKEVLRENKRMINRAVRELDREKTGLEREEKRLTMEIKKAAKEGQMGAVKIMAKVSRMKSSRVESGQIDIVSCPKMSRRIPTKSVRPVTLFVDKGPTVFIY